MLGRQQRVLDAFHRARAWLHRNRGAMDSPTLARKLDAFDEVLARADRATMHQVSGQRRSRDATQELRVRVKELLQRHLRPISAIAQAAAAEIDIRQGCRMPRKRVPVMELLANARGIGEAAGRHAALFVDCGRPVDFVARLDAATNDVRRAVLRRSRAVGLHVGATAALVQHLKAARQLLEILDCHVRTAFEDDAGMLAEWRASRRVHLRGAASREDAGAEAAGVVEVPQVAEPLKLVSAA